MAEDYEEVQVKMFCGACPDSHCGKLLYFISHVNSEVECSDCGQKHNPNSLLNVKESSDSNVAVGNLLKSILLSNTVAKKGSELVKVRGLSNFHCKIISPLLTSYGMDKKTGKAKLLSELGQAEVFNCAVFGNRAFLIEKEHLDTPGYGRDNTGSLGYLSDTLGMIEEANGGNCLVPLHSDGDGHCLVHAISRAVVGRELLWHSLRQNLKDHLQQENMGYQGLFRDFVDTNEWDEIINEADPNYHPPTNEPFGLRNIHVFGLANVLHRPIILLDSLEGMQSSGDYSGIFLPVLVSPEKCKSQGSLNKPLAIAWSSLARNHYVPLVGIKESTIPKIPFSLLPKAWGLPNELVSTYIEFDENGNCEIGGSRTLQDSYVQRLVSAMNELFIEKHAVSPELVADVNQFIFKPSNAVGISIPEIIEFTQNAVKNESLVRCLSCQVLKEVKNVCPRSWREPGGRWYTRAQESNEGLIANAVYMFTEAKGVHIMYQPKFDMLMPVVEKDQQCDLCQGVTREVSANGSVRYMNGDRTSTQSNNSNGCTCGFKHFWNNVEYDNVPKIIDVSFEWNGKTIEEQVFWFDNESDPSLNSNVYELATNVVQKHFPGEFGSETVVRKVVDKILRETELKKNEEVDPRPPDSDSQPMDTDNQQATSSTPSKIILTGPKHKTLHKEELTMNEEERLTKARITHHAAFSQKRKSAKQSPEKPSGSTKHGKQETQKAKKEDTKPQITASATKPPPQGIPSQAKPTDIKIRLTSSSGKTATITLKPSSTYADLQKTIHAELGIPNERQKIRYGFPPCVLKPPEDEHATLPLTHGDRVSVEELPDLKAQEAEKITKEPETESMDVEVKETVEEDASSSDDPEGVDRETLASDLLGILQGALKVDLWDSVQHKPELFDRGGMIYDQIVSKLGPLRDDMHCNVMGLPGKTFAYNASEDRFEICLGQKHIRVQPLDAEMLSQVHARSGDLAPLRRPQDERESLGAFSGAVRHRDASEGRAAFSGAGRTLGGSMKTSNVPEHCKTQKEEGDLLPMNDDVQDKGSTHAQSTSHDPSISSAILEKTGNMEVEGTIMDTKGGESSTTQFVPSIVEISVAEKDENVAHKNVHETSSIEHGGSSIEHEVSKLKPVAASVDQGMEVDEHEVKNSQNEASTFEHEVSRIDLWDSVQHKPELFDRGGMIYDQIVSKLGPLRDDMHCNVMGLPGKIFAYNASEDRFEICLGQKKHIRVQPLDAEMLSQAHARSGDLATLRRPQDERESLGAFSGAVRHRDASEGRAALSGAGRTLGGSMKTSNVQKKDGYLLPMNDDVQDKGSTHAQGTSHDPSISGAILEKTGNMEMEGTIMDTKGGESSTTQFVPSVVEISVAEKDENVAHKNVHETSSIEHGDSSIEHEVSKLEPVAASVDQGMEVDEHEVKNSQNEASTFEHEVSKIDEAVGEC